ncbi:MAG TPA: M1 family aminopeptidase [Polyangia bacterium]|nr:M1 family aminopeptidase [Polyangia bacterium]
MSTLRLERELCCRRDGSLGDTAGTSGPQPFVLPGARAVYAPDRVCDVRHIKIEILLDFATRSVSGACTQTIAPLNDGPTRLRLDAVEMHIDAVTLADGTRLPHSHDGQHLLVDLGPRRAGEIIDLVVRYHATPRRGLYFLQPDELHPHRPVQVWSQGQDDDNRFWFPCFDHPHEKSTSEVVATVPEKMTVMSNGRLVSMRGSTRGTRTFHFRHEVPHSSYLITLVAGEYVELRDQIDDVQVQYLVPPGREEDARRAFGRTPEMIRLFGEKIGHPYPYEKYAQVVVSDFIFGGMENTSATTITELTLHDARAHLDFSSAPLVAHELAHQWFGDLVTCRDWSHGWLNEGFATYFEIVWKEHAEGRDAADYDRLADMDAYFEEDGGRYRRPMVTNVFHEPLDVFDRHLYERGGAVLHMLRHQLSWGTGATREDDRFWKAIRHYVGKHRTGSVESRDLARAIEEATGVNADRFFDQWVFGAGYPVLEVDYSFDEFQHLARVAIKQTHEIKEGTPLFAFPLDLCFVVDGVESHFTVQVEEAQHIFFFPLPGRPTQAIIDPGAHLLKKSHERKPPGVWMSELTGARHAIDRVRAARALGKAGDPLALPALARAMVEDPVWSVRGEAALAIGQLRVEAARDALVGAVRVETHHKARRLLVRALGEFRHDRIAAQAAAQVLSGDPSYFVEAEAAIALGRTRTEGALEALLGGLGIPSYLEVRRSACLTGLGELRDERAFSVALEEAAPGKPPTSRRAALALIATLGDEHPGLRRRALEALAGHLTDPDFRVRIAAIEALRTLGDARALAPLARVESADLEPRVRRRAREASRALQEGLRAKEQSQALRDELERLREGYDKLRERLFKLETLTSD